MGRHDFRGEEPINLEEKACCVFVVDTSSSMEGLPIRQLNDGLKLFASEIRDMDHVRHRLEVVLIEFNSDVRTVLPPTLGINLSFPLLGESGSTKLVDGVLEAIETAKTRTRWYDETGQPRKRPWVILLTDGYPDPEQDIARLQDAIRKGETEKSFIFLPIGVDGADGDFLSRIAMSNKELRPRSLSSTRFSEFFRWVSDLMGKVVESRPGTQLMLPRANDWDQGVDI